MIPTYHCNHSKKEKNRPTWWTTALYRNFLAFLFALIRGQQCAAWLGNGFRDIIVEHWLVFA
jgi:hypothetical protein